MWTQVQWDHPVLSDGDRERAWKHVVSNTLDGIHQVLVVIMLFSFIGCTALIVIAVRMH